MEDHHNLVASKCIKDFLIAVIFFWSCAGGSGSSSSGGAWVKKTPSKAAPASSQGLDHHAAHAMASQSKESLPTGKWLWRAMTVDLVEVDDGQRPQAPTLRGVDLAKAALQAVATGSKWKTPSPFAHFSRSFDEARKWWRKGTDLRREREGLICRVDIAALSQVLDLENGMEDLQYLDFSSEKSQTRLLNAYVASSQVQDLLPAATHARKCHEVLVSWRHRLPRRIFQVVHPDTGEFIRNLDSEALSRI